MNTAVKDGYTGRPAKLREGSWGAHVNNDSVQPGDVVHLTTKGGKEWDSMVEKVVWKGVDSDGQPCALCTLVTKDKPASPASAAASGEGEGENDF